MNDDLSTFLTMLCKEDFSKCKTGNVGYKITLPKHQIEITFDINGKFERISNERRCSNMICIKGES